MSAIVCCYNSPTLITTTTIMSSYDLWFLTSWADVHPCSEVPVHQFSYQRQRKQFVVQCACLRTCQEASGPTLNTSPGSSFSPFPPPCRQRDPNWSWRRRRRGLGWWPTARSRTSTSSCPPSLPSNAWWCWLRTCASCTSPPAGSRRVTSPWRPVGHERQRRLRHSHQG